MELIVPYVKGGGTDKRTRLVARVLERELGHPINVVNRTGAVVGHTVIAEAKPDGETIGMITGEIGMMHWFSQVTNLTWRDYTPLAVPYVEAAAIIVRGDAPFKSLADFLEVLRARPMRGSGSPDFGVWKFALVGLLNAVGIDPRRIEWIPTISGEEGIEKVIAGEVDVAPVPMVEAPELILAKKVRPLATMDDVRHPKFPDVPTVKEAIGVSWRVAHWRGVVGPAGLPFDVKTRLVAALRRVSVDPDFLEECRANGFSLEWRFGGDFADYMRKDDEQFGGIITRFEEGQ